MKTKILELNKTPYENGKTSGAYFRKQIDSQVIKKIDKIDIKGDLLNRYIYIINSFEE